METGTFISTTNDYIDFYMNTITVCSKLARPWRGKCQQFSRGGLDVNTPKMVYEEQIYRKPVSTFLYHTRTIDTLNQISPTTIKLE